MSLDLDNFSNCWQRKGIIHRHLYKNHENNGLNEQQGSVIWCRPTTGVRYSKHFKSNCQIASSLFRSSPKEAVQV